MVIQPACAGNSNTATLKQCIQWSTVPLQSILFSSQGFRAVMRLNLMSPMVKPRFMSGITTAPCTAQAALRSRHAQQADVLAAPQLASQHHNGSARSSQHQFQQRQPEHISFLTEQVWAAP